MPDCRWIRILLRMLYETVFTALLLFFFSITVLGKLPGFWGLFVLFCLFVLSFGIREWVPANLLILLFHLLIIGGIYILPFYMGLRILLIAIQLYLTISALVYSCRGAVIKPLTEIPWPSFLTCTVVYILGIATHVPALITRAYIITILLLVIYYIMLYVEGLTQYIDAEKNVSGLPLKRMLHTNTSIVGIIIFILLSGLFLGHIFGSDELTDAIADAIHWFFRTMFHYFILLLEFIGKFLTQYLGLEELKPDFVGGEPELTTGWGLIVELVLSFVFLAVFSILLYHWMRKLIQLLLKPRSYEEDVIEEAEKEKILIKEKSKGRKYRYHPLTLMEKARRLYRQRVLSYREEIKLAQNTTCRDIEKEVEEKKQVDIHELTELYAGLRYGGQEADKAVIKKMRQLTGK